MHFDQTDHLISYLIGKIVPHADIRRGGILAVSLAKLLFLIDYEHFKATGKQASDLTYIWYKHGPYPLTDFEPRLAELEGHEIVRLPMERVIDGRPYSLFYAGRSPRYTPSLPESVKEIADRVIFIFGEASQETLLEYVYSLEIVKGLELMQPIDFTRALAKPEVDETFLNTVLEEFKGELTQPLSPEHIKAVQQSLEESTNENIETAKQMLSWQRAAFRLNSS
ncbi:MAG: hypothetical protein COS88_04530 [Chloroflexi bacterium CG07_land_8_20_14_0_80_51_10]|nr:MAG: hypothetical protein COS88_04530 [Chloroflexi bacterium CG07_land_8_20_14_0_80_51_10]